MHLRSVTSQSRRFESHKTENGIRAVSRSSFMGNVP